MSDKKRTALRFIIPFIVLALGISGAVTLSSRKKPPGRTRAKHLGVLVEVATAAAGKRVLDVAAKGEVTASRTVVLQPRVVGEVVWISDKLVVGGLVEKGEPLIKVERTDYQIALDQQTLFRTAIKMPANLTEGDYVTRIFLTRGGQIISSYQTSIDVRKVGLERWLFTLSRQQPLLYGLMSLAIAITAGWGASAAFQAMRRS